MLLVPPTGLYPTAEALALPCLLCRCLLQQGNRASLDGCQQMDRKRKYGIYTQGDFIQHERKRKEAGKWMDLKSL